MIQLRKLALPAVLLLVSTGCASRAGRMPEGVPTVERREETLRNMFEQVDRNTAEIRAARDELQALRRKVEAVETGMQSAAAAESAQIHEIKENVSFLSEQILRLDSSLRNGDQAAGPRGADVFKPNGFTVESAYKEALGDYQARRYETAIGKFNEIITVAPSSSLADNAQYWIGESWYGLKNYERSLQAFQKVFSFPKTNKAADARLKIGMIYLHMNNPTAAREELNTVLEKYPDSDAAKIAASKLKALE